MVVSQSLTLNFNLILIKEAKSLKRPRFGLSYAPFNAPSIAAHLIACLLPIGLFTTDCRNELVFLRATD